MSKTKRTALRVVATVILTVSYLLAMLGIEWYASWQCVRYPLFGYLALSVTLGVVGFEIHAKLDKDAKRGQVGQPILEHKE